jgi:F-type H+-transporting ATPase subunit alpha
VEVLKQKNNAPVEVADQVCILYAVVNGYLKDISVDQIAEFELRLREFMANSRYNTVLTAIRETGKLEADTETELKHALEELLKEFRPQQ